MFDLYESSNRGTLYSLNAEPLTSLIATMINSSLLTAYVILIIALDAFDTPSLLVQITKVFYVIMTSWDVVAHIWHHMFLELLRKISQITCETFDALAVYVLIQTVLSLCVSCIVLGDADDLELVYELMIHLCMLCVPLEFDSCKDTFFVAYL